MRLATYARVSIGDQSIAPQQDVLRTYASARGLEIAYEFVDHGISGSKDRRPALDEMLAKAKRRAFDAVAVVKLMGDGTLMEFGSVVDAINFAVDVQRMMAERNTGVPEDRRGRQRSMERFRRARLGSSPGRNGGRRGRDRPRHSILRPTWAKASSTNSRTVWLSPVAST